MFPKESSGVPSVVQVFLCSVWVVFGLSYPRVLFFFLARPPGLPDPAERGIPPLDSPSLRLTLLTAVRLATSSIATW